MGHELTHAFDDQGEQFTSCPVSWFRSSYPLVMHSQRGNLNVALHETICLNNFKQLLEQPESLMTEKRSFPVARS